MRFLSSGGLILKPADCSYLNRQGEHAVVIGRTAWNATPNEAWDFIAGFCPALDTGLQDFRDTKLGLMLRVKGTDTLLPIGIGIVRGVNLFERTLRIYIDGRIVREASIGEDSIWGPHEVIADIARHVMLVPDNVILMGMPCHPLSVAAGDMVECELTGPVRLSVTVEAIDPAQASAFGVGHAPTNSPEVRRIALGFDECVLQRLRDNLASAKAACPR